MSLWRLLNPFFAKWRISIITSVATPVRNMYVMYRVVSTRNAGLVILNDKVARENVIAKINNAPASSMWSVFTVRPRILNTNLKKLAL